MRDFLIISLIYIFVTFATGTVIGLFMYALGPQWILKPFVTGYVIATLSAIFTLVMSKTD